MPRSGAPMDPRELDRLRRRLGLTRIEMAMATGFSEQRDGRPIEVPPALDDTDAPVFGQDVD